MLILKKIETKIMSKKYHQNYSNLTIVYLGIKNLKINNLGLKIWIKLQLVIWIKRKLTGKIYKDW